MNVSFPDRVIRFIREHPVTIITGSVVLALLLWLGIVVSPIFGIVMLWVVGIVVGSVLVWVGVRWLVISIAYEWRGW